MYARPVSSGTGDGAARLNPTTPATTDAIQQTTTQTAFRDVEAPPAMACQSHTQQKYNPKRVCPVREENKAAAKR